VNGGENTRQYYTPLAVAKFTGKRKKIKSGYFIATPRMDIGWFKHNFYIYCLILVKFRISRMLIMMSNIYELHENIRWEGRTFLMGAN